MVHFTEMWQILYDRKRASKPSVYSLASILQSQRAATLPLMDNLQYLFGCVVLLLCVLCQ